jgi:glycosyltransferase involved in cell wall biosynthesis
MTTTYDFIVVIPCFNDLEGLRKALSSIHYHNGDFAVLVIDDGSKVPIKPVDLVSSLPRDTTVELLRLSENVGITKALNAGLLWIAERNNIFFSCKYIARLDCGDTCDNSRFNKQVRFLEEHREIDLLGSWCVFENYETGDKFVYKTPTCHKQIRRAMHFRNIFIHPTVMWRMTVMKNFGKYPENFPHAEDYGLFYQWMDANIRTAVIPEKLVTCRINNKGLSLANRRHQLHSRIKVIRTYGSNKFFRTLGILKLWALLALPYSWVFRMKKLLAGER